MKIRNVFLSLLAVALIWACGKDDDPAPPKNNAPVIAAKTFAVAENIAPGTAIGTVTATDADKDALTFSIATNDSDLFAITKAGVLSLASGKTLSFATKAQHVITVAVSDGEASASAKVTINVTKVDPENLAPVIEPQEFSVVESIDAAVEIGVVSATDPEGADLIFTIVANDNDLFALSAKGALTLAEGKQLDFGTAQQHNITVGVTDGNSSVTADITITVTQDPLPTGDPQSFEADENIADTEVIGTVVAEDPEGQALTFSIKTNDNDLFEITEGGELSLAAGMALDFETQDQHDIVVSVGDGYNSIDINVSIKVLDDGVLADDPTSFVTTWKTEFDGEKIGLFTANNYDYNYTIDWGDGTSQVINTSGAKEHTYTTAGTYTVAIKGVFPHFSVVDSPYAKKLAALEQWGSIQWQSLKLIFADAENMVYNATDVPDLTNVTDMSQMFSGASSFNADLSDWDVSNVTDMSDMFQGATAFNGAIGNWEVSNVTDMSYMFQGATAFNQDLSAWGDKLGNVTNMSSMFDGATSFDQDLSGWDVSNVTDMGYMFWGATAFNQDLSGWGDKLGNVIDMSSMFAGATAFNQDLSGWNVVGVTDMAYMFWGASAFDQSLASWNIGNVTDMTGMLDNSGLSPANLNATLISWSTPTQGYDPPINMVIGIDGLAFCGQEAFDAANTLDQTYGWTFEGNFIVNPVCN